jgi:hypothetical protein
VHRPTTSDKKVVGVFVHFHFASAIISLVTISQMQRFIEKPVSPVVTNAINKTHRHGTLLMKLP